MYESSAVSGGDDTAPTLCESVGNLSQAMGTGATAVALSTFGPEGALIGTVVAPLAGTYTSFISQGQCDLYVSAYTTIKAFFDDEDDVVITSP